MEVTLSFPVSLQEFLNQNLLDVFLEVSKESTIQQQQQQQKEFNQAYFNNQTITIENFEKIVQNFQSAKHNNVVKNILKSFQKFIQNLDQQEQQLIFEYTKKTYNYKEIKKIIKRSISTFGKRWNMKLKFIIEKSLYKPLFEYYLKYRAFLWLNQSKVQHKEQHLAVLNFLKEAINNPLYIDLIKYYKKHKKINFQ
ncbi:hypothetical protein ABPG74_016053 [Tetrahymena malaccensis]